MRSRNIDISLRLNEKEADKLNRLVKRSGLSREAYLRQLINGLVPRDAPPPDYYAMMKELHAVGRNLNQIAQKAHALGVIDVVRYKDESGNTHSFVDDDLYNAGRSAVLNAIMAFQFIEPSPNSHQ